MEDYMSDREYRKLRREAIREQLQERNEQEERSSANSNRTDRVQQGIENSTNEKQEEERSANSYGTDRGQPRLERSTRERQAMERDRIRNSGSKDSRTQNITQQNELQLHYVDKDNIDLTNEIKELDKKLLLLRQSNSDILSHNNVLTSTPSTHDQETAVCSDYNYNQTEMSGNRITHGVSRKETSYRDNVRDDKRCKNTEDINIRDTYVDKAYTDRRESRLYDSNMKDDTNKKKDSDETGVKQTDSATRTDGILDANKRYKEGMYSQSNRHNIINYPADEYTIHDSWMEHNRLDDRQHMPYIQNTGVSPERARYTVDTETLRHNREVYDPPKVSQQGYSSDYARNYDSNRQNIERKVTEEVVRPKVKTEDQYISATYNRFGEEYYEYDHRDQRMKEEDRVRMEIERERVLLRRLHEQNKQIEYERKIKEQEEREVIEKIHRLQIAEDELKEQRTEREKLEREIQKKIELEKLRTEKLLLLKQQEQELYDKAERRKIRKDYTDGILEDQVRPITSIEPKVYTSGFGKPKIPPFDGNDFKVWKIEVECIIKSKMYPEYLIAQTMRSSLKGQTRRVLLTIDPMATSAEILKKLEDIYGTTQTEDSIMQDFFNAKQEEKETTSDWALRLETIMQLAVETGEIPESKKNALLKQRFWKGLKSEKLRNNTRVTYESNATFEILRKKARVEEDEIKRTPSDPKVNKPLNTQTTQSDLNKEPTLVCEKDEVLLQQHNFKMTSSYMDKQMNMMQSLMDKMKELEQEITNIRKENKRSDIPENRERNRDYSYRGRYPRRGRPYYYDPPRRVYKDYYDSESHRYQGPPKQKEEPKDTSEAAKPTKENTETKKDLNK